jgi:preprotein translocase SecE subunit
MKLLAYFQGVYAELLKVSWPTVPQVLRNLAAVVIGIGIAILVIGGFDYIFFKLLGLIIKH